MPWEITITRRDGEPLGSPKDVIQAISRAFPDVMFYREPSGTEKMASLPPDLEIPDAIREHWETSAASVQGDFEAAGYSIRFYLGNEDASSLTTVRVETRGDSRPAMPMMETLTLATGWVVLDELGDTVVDGGITAPHAR